MPQKRSPLPLLIGLIIGWAWGFMLSQERVSLIQLAIMVGLTLAVFLVVPSALGRR